MPRHDKQYIRDNKIVDDARFLKAAAVTQLEKQIKQNPSDHDVRLQLIGYYFMHAKSRTEKLRRFNHIIRLIENEPEAPIHFSMDLDCSSSIRYTDKQFETYCKLWITQAKQNPENATILGNAGHAIVDYDFNRAIKLLERASGLEPDRFDWAAELCFQYSRRLHFTPALSSAQKTRCAKMTIEWGERYMALLGRRKELGGRIVYSEHCARAALYLDQYSTALNYINRSLNIFDKINCPPFDSCVAVQGLAFIGLGETRKASNCLHLLQLDHPIYSSDDEAVVLANKLLSVGETASVIKYLRRCKAKKLIDPTKVDKWIAMLKAGKPITIKVPTVYAKPLN